MSFTTFFHYLQTTFCFDEWVLQFQINFLRFSFFTYSSVTEVGSKIIITTWHDSIQLFLLVKVTKETFLSQQIQTANVFF